MARTCTTRNRLLEACLRILQEHSYGRSSVDEICQAARVQKGSFYYFFKSKAALAVATLEQTWLACVPALDDAYTPSVAPLDRLRKHCALLLQDQCGLQKRTGAVPGCPYCALGSEIGAEEPIIRAKVIEIIERQLTYIASAIRDAQKAGLVRTGDPVVQARQVWALMSGTLGLARIENSLEPLRGMADGVIDFLGASPAARPARKPASNLIYSTTKSNRN